MLYLLASLSFSRQFRFSQSGLVKFPTIIVAGTNSRLFPMLFIGMLFT